MKTPGKILKRMAMPVTEALEADRWQLTDTHSISFFSPRDIEKAHSQYLSSSEK